MSAIEALLAVAPQLRDGMRPGPDHVMVRCMFHGGGKENTPSMSLSLSKPVYYCFAGDTLVLTQDGSRPIRDLAGSVHKVLVPGGYWVEAPFYSFGEQRIYELTLSRNGIKKKISTTEEHRWFVQGAKGKKKEQTTQKLKKGEVLVGCFPVSLSSRTDGQRPITPSPYGIARGITYGDGTTIHTGGSLAYLHGAKDAELLKWFPLSDTYGDKSKRRTTITDLPTYFKTDIPPSTESVPYLYGWLAGYFAADGDISVGGTANINSVKQADLEKVQTICTRIGIATTGIKTYMRNGYNGLEPIHRLGLYSDTLPEEFFLLSAHRDRFKRLEKKYARKHWQVVSVRKTKRYEEVFCAIVEKYGAFTLDGNILTGNCHACKISGHIAQLLRRAGLSRDAVEVLLPKDSAYKKQEHTLAAKLVKGTDLFRGQFILDEELLDYYRLAPTALLHAGYKKSTLRHFEVGYDSTNVRITYPLRNVYGDLVGISGRAAMEGIEPRYKIYDKELKDREDFNIPDTYTMEAIKSAVLWHGHVVRPLFFKQSHSSFMVITEGFKACMWTWQSGIEDTVALVGSYLTEHHAELISRVVPQVVLFLDNNEAGWVGTKKAAKRLMKRSVDVRVARYPDTREQPDDLDEYELNDAVINNQSMREWTAEHVIYEAARTTPRTPFLQ